MRQLYFLVAIIAFFNSFGHAQNITLNTQAEVDAFDQTLTVITGNLKIEGLPYNSDQITDLSNLSSLISIDGDLTVINNASLIGNLNGLSNIKSIGGNLNISDNPSLTNIGDLLNLTTVNGGILISLNDGLLNVNGLSNLTRIIGDLWISWNYSLENIEGFNNISVIEGNLAILNNSSLTNLSGLSNVSIIGLNVDIEGNRALGDCCGIQDLLASNATFGNINIANNLNGCNNQDAIINDCSSGIIFEDINFTCDREFNQTGLRGRRATINPGNIIVETNNIGGWKVDRLDIGSYTISYDTSGAWEGSLCPMTHEFEVLEQDLIPYIPPYGMNISNTCQPRVTVGMSFARPCFEQQRINIQICNDNSALQPVTESYLECNLDPILLYQNASMISTMIDNQTYRFDIENINSGECLNLWIDVMVSCDVVLGQNFCIEAKLNPIETCSNDISLSIPSLSTCSLPYDDSDLRINRYCNNDSIFFEIINDGVGDMICYSPVRLFIDGVFQWKDSIKLASLENRRFAFDGDGLTWRMEVDQHPGYKGLSRPTATSERCGDVGNWRPGFVNIRYQDDIDPSKDIFCAQVTGSFDPNDKTGYPLGVTDQNRILPNEPLEYRIRFQNTGTDTAFTVVIRDTLEMDFNIFSVQTGVSSHEYEFKLYGPRVLEWTFNNILLPDSTTNEPASHGFVVFQVRQNLDLPNETQLKNSAGIYFDFNDPVITNTTLHTVHDGIQDLISSTNNPGNNNDQLFNVFPSPTNGEINIDFRRNYNIINIKIYNSIGQLINSNNYKSIDQLSANLSGPSGLYFIHVQVDNNRQEVIRIIKE